MVDILGCTSNLEIKKKRITFLLEKPLEDKLKEFQSELLLTEKDVNWNFSDILIGVIVAGLANPKSDIKKTIVKHKKESA